MESPGPLLYEGMFLLSLHAGEDGPQGVDLVRNLLDRVEAEVVSLRRWDERRLAYPIKGQKRGVYYLALFRADPGSLAHIERDCNLSESVLRAMMLRADHYGETEIEAELEQARLAETMAVSRPGEGAGGEGASSREPVGASS